MAELIFWSWYLNKNRTGAGWSSEASKGGATPGEPWAAHPPLQQGQQCELDLALSSWLKVERGSMGGQREDFQVPTENYNSTWLLSDIKSPLAKPGWESEPKPESAQGLARSRQTFRIGFCQGYEVAREYGKWGRRKKSGHMQGSEPTPLLGPFG